MKRGDIVNLGPHRLMCGDCTDPEDVKSLFGKTNADIVVTSPPYMQQRKYQGQSDIGWNQLMQRSFDLIPTHQKTQMLVNLGMVHRQHEWIDYWTEWANWMSRKGIKKIGWYVWDKIDGIPTVPAHGRLYNCHEFVFHFARSPVSPNKTCPCKSAGKRRRKMSMSSKNGMTARFIPGGTRTHSCKIADSVVRITTRGKRLAGQNAHYPVGLPGHYIRCFSQEGDTVYDPFSGSGSTILAAHVNKRIGFGMEQSPEYCELAVERFKKHLEANCDALDPKRKAVTA